MSEPQQITIPPGHVIITTWGMVRGETVQSLLDSRAFTDAQGLTGIQWQLLPGALPEKTRNEAVRNLLRDPNAGWLLQIDADMQWAPDAIVNILRVAYGDVPHADVIGAYCPLRGELALPTIDTGTGTWESHFPGSGTLEVIRTGAAFHLTKRHVYEALRDPWYRLRVPARPIDFLAEVDNYARIKFDGRNPFRGRPDQAWERLEQCARDDPSAAPEQFVPQEVGEDSGFCDRVKAAGFRIFVATDIPVGHVETKVTTWQTHAAAMESMRANQLLTVGVIP